METTDFADHKDGEGSLRFAAAEKAGNPQLKMPSQRGQAGGGHRLAVALGPLVRPLEGDARREFRELARKSWNSAQWAMA